MIRLSVDRLIRALVLLSAAVLGGGMPGVANAQATQPEGGTPAIQRGAPFVLGDCVQALTATTVQTSGAPCASGTFVSSIEEDNVEVVGGAATLNFSTGFDITDAGAGQANVAIDAAELETAFEAVLDLQDLQGAVTDSQVPNNITIDLAAAATALAANGANCSAGEFPLGVDASGAAEGCTALPTSISGTANEIAASAATGAVTLSLPAAIDLGGKTSFELPNGAAPTVDAFGEIAGDSDLWAASRGAPVFFDGTAAVALVGVLVSDSPSDGQVPKWNTGGTITWEDDSGGAGGVGSSSDTEILFNNSASVDGVAGFTWNGSALSQPTTTFSGLLTSSSAGVLLASGGPLAFGDGDSTIDETSDDVVEFAAGGALLMNLSLALGVQFHDLVDDTKIAQLDMSAITTGNARVFAFPDESGTLLTDQTTIDISANTNLAATSPVTLTGDDIGCATCLVDGDIDASPGVVGIDANGDAVIPRDLTVTRNLTVGDGTVAGQLAMLELAVNGANHRTWKVPDALTASLVMEFGDSIPTAADQVALFSDGSGGTSTVTWGDPLLEGELDSLAELNSQIADATMIASTTSVEFGESFAFSNPVTGHSELLQIKKPFGYTITEVCASTDTGTVTVQFDERAASTPNSAGTDVLTAALDADSDEQCTTGFDNAAIAADALLNVDFDAVASSPTQVRIHVTYSRTLL